MENTDILNDDERLLIQAICLHFDLSPNKVTLGEFSRIITMPGLMDQLVYSKSEEARRFGGSNRHIATQAMNIIKWSAVSKIYNAPDAD